MYFFPNSFMIWIWTCIRLIDRYKFKKILKKNAKWVYSLWIVNTILGGGILVDALQSTCTSMAYLFGNAIQKDRSRHEMPSFRSRRLSLFTFAFRPWTSFTFMLFIKKLPDYFWNPWKGPLRQAVSKILKHRCLPRPWIFNKHLSIQSPAFLPLPPSAFISPLLLIYRTFYIY